MEVVETEGYGAYPVQRDAIWRKFDRRFFLS